MLLALLLLAADVQGIISQNTTWSGSVRMVGDVVVSRGATLTISAGTSVSVASSDAQAAGLDPARVELLVDGALQIAGTPSAPVTFSPLGPQGSWVGIHLRLGGTAGIAFLSGGGGITTVQLDDSGSVTGGRITGQTGLLVKGGIATVADTSFECSDIAATVAGGDATFSRVVITGGKTGIDMEGGTTRVDHALVGGTALRAFYAASGTITGTIDHSTVTGNSGHALEVAALTLFGSPALFLTNSIVASNGGAGISMGGLPVVLGSAPTLHNCDFWNNAGGDLPAGLTPDPGSFSANPLLVGNGNPRITEHSPARFAAGDGSDIGARAYAGDPTPGGLKGTLFSDTTLSGDVLVDGDLTVPAGVALTLSPGARLSLAEGDLMKAGVDLARIELIVRGRLSIPGTAAAPVVFIGPGSGAAWYGVRVEPGSSTDVRYAGIAQAVRGFSLKENASISHSSFSGATCVAVLAGSATITEGEFTGCTTAGVQVAGGTATVTGSTFSRSGRGVDVSGGNALVDRSLFVNGGYGLYANGGAGALTHITVHGSTNDGVRVAMASGSANAFAVRDSIVSGSGGYGIYANGPLQTDHNDVWSSATANYPGAVTPGAGSISLNPLYAGPGDYHLSAGSPCIGAGNGGTDLGALSSVPAGSVDHIVVLPANSIADAGSSVTFTAQAYDAAGTAVPATYTWSAASRAGTIDQSGKLTVACAAGTVTGAVTASAAGRSGSANLTIRAGAAARIVLSPDNATVSAGGTQQYAADATDACLNTVPTGPVTWALEAGAGSISASGLLVAGTRTGTYSVSAQAQGLQGSTKVTIAESSAAAIHITPASVTIAPGGVTTLSAVVTDASGNPTSDPVTWSCNPAAGAISAGGVYVAGNTPGIHTGAIVAASGSLQARATVIISAAALSQLVLQPVWPSVRVGGTVQFTASGVDGAGNSVPVTATWSILRGGGTLSAEGLFTAGHVPGTWLNTVQATASGLGATATVVTTPGPAVLITVSPTRPTLAPGGTQRFTAKAMDVYGNETGKTGLVWTADPRAGTIDAQGTFTAGAAGGDYDDSVVAALGNISGTASVRIGQSDPGDAGVSDGGPPAPVPVRGCGSAGGAPVLGLLLILALRRRGRLPA